MWTLKDEYRDLLDAKLSAATKAEALEALLSGWDQDAGNYEIEKPSLTLKALKPVQYHLERRLWDTAYYNDRGGPRVLPKEELLELLQEAITER